MVPLINDCRRVDHGKDLFKLLHSLGLLDELVENPIENCVLKVVSKPSVDEEKSEVRDNLEVYYPSRLNKDEAHESYRS